MQVATVYQLETYHGWANRLTWSVMFWLCQDDTLFKLAMDHVNNTKPFDENSACQFVLLWMPNGTPDMKNPHEYKLVNWRQIANGLNEICSDVK